jgi:Na+/proline symporter
LYSFANARGISVPLRTDQLFPLLALQHLGALAAIAFVLGLTAATFSSADSVLTTLTTSFCIDVLGSEEPGRFTERQKTWLRHSAHIGFAVALLIVILIFWSINKVAVIEMVLDIANFTYGPLLGLFAFGLLSGTSVRDRWVPVVCVVAPILCYVLSAKSVQWLNGYRFGQELLIVNGLLTALGLWTIARRGSYGGSLSGVGGVTEDGRRAAGSVSFAQGNEGP